MPRNTSKTSSGRDDNSIHSQAPRLWSSIFLYPPHILNNHGATFLQDASTSQISHSLATSPTDIECARVALSSYSTPTTIYPHHNNGTGPDPRNRMAIYTRLQGSQGSREQSILLNLRVRHTCFTRECGLPFEEGDDHSDD